MRCINAGSGQRPFAPPWVNFDIQASVTRDGKLYKPDLVADMFHMPFRSNTVDYVVSSHTIEHLGCGEASGFIAEAWRILKAGGSFIVSIPDIRALAQRWLTRQISDYIFTVNMMGAFMGSIHDIHRWHYTYAGLQEILNANGTWSTTKRFNNREISGMDLAVDWWILTVEAIK